MPTSESTKQSRQSPRETSQRELDWKRKKLGHIVYGITFGWVAKSPIFEWEYRIYRNPITHRYDLWIFGPEDGWEQMEMEGITNPLKVATGVRSADRAKNAFVIVEEIMIALWKEDRKKPLVTLK